MAALVPKISLNGPNSEGPVRGSTETFVALGDACTSVMNRLAADRDPVAIHDVGTVADPALASIAATVALALDAFGGPPERARDCVARLYGLRGADSLLPWIDGQTEDVAELARLDYEPTAGADWPTVWEGHLAESFVVLEAQVGPAWKDRVRPQRYQSVKANCRQGADRSSNQNGGVRHAA